MQNWSSAFLALQGNPPTIPVTNLPPRPWRRYIGLEKQSLARYCAIDRFEKLKALQPSPHSSEPSDVSVGKAIVNEPGKMLFIFGLLIAAVGLVIWSGVGKGWLGRMPGDVHYTKGNFSLHFPVVTCLLVSIVLTFLIWLFRK
jgi:hypothetical protein